MYILLAIVKLAHVWSACFGIALKAFSCFLPCEAKHEPCIAVQDFDNFMKGWQSQLDEAAYWVDPDDIEVSVFGGATAVAASAKLAILLNIKLWCPWRNLWFVWVHAGHCAR